MEGEVQPLGHHGRSQRQDGRAIGADRRDRVHGRRAYARGSRKPIGCGGQRLRAASVAPQNEIAITMHSPMINAARKFTAALATYFIPKLLRCGVRAARRTPAERNATPRSRIEGYIYHPNGPLEPFPTGPVITVV